MVLQGQCLSIPLPEAGYRDGRLTAAHTTAKKEGTVVAQNMASSPAEWAAPMNTHEPPPYFSDRALARRLERAEARANAEFVEARAHVRPDCGAEWIEVAGAFAMYDGVNSPLTQTFGLGLFDPVGDSEMATLEGFFRQRGAEVCHEISPLADPSLLLLLNERGYQPLEFSSVLSRPIRPGIELNTGRGEAIKVRLALPGEEELWAETALRGWQDTAPQFVEFMRELGPINTHRANSRCFLAEWRGEPIAAGALCLFEGVALLAGASTRPEWRKRGAQLALLESRLRYGAEQGCELAMIAAQPGSASQRNAERHGFRIAYTRLKWRLASRAT